MERKILSYSISLALCLLMFLPLRAQNGNPTVPPPGSTSQEGEEGRERRSALSVIQRHGSIHPVRYKLISYRPFGVREEYRTYQSPSKEYMEQLEELAYKSGFDDVVTT